MSIENNLLDEFIKLEEEFKNDPEMLAILEEEYRIKLASLQEEQESSSFDKIGAGEKYNYEEAAAELDQLGNEPFVESGIRTNPVLPRFSATGNLGDMALDIGSGIGRGGLALMEGGIAKGAELYTGGDLPIGEIMLESLMRTGGKKEQGGLESFGEDVLRDPTLLVPGLGQAKIVKNIGSGVGRLGVLAAQEGALEATSQLLDSDREMDVANIVLAGATLPGVEYAGKGLKNFGKGLANMRFGDDGGQLLEEGLIPIIGSPNKLIEPKIKGLKEERLADVQQTDLTNKLDWDAKELELLEQGVDPQDILAVRFEEQNAPLRDFDVPIQRKLEDDEQFARILTDDYMNISNEVEKLKVNLNASVDSGETLLNFSKILKERAKQPGSKGIAAKLFLDEIEPQLRSYDKRFIAGGTPVGNKLDFLEGIKLKEGEIDSPVLRPLRSTGQLLNRGPLIKGTYGLGRMTDSDRTRVTPELITNIFDEINKEKED
jgi:hypothetical protein